MEEEPERKNLLVLPSFEKEPNASSCDGTKYLNTYVGDKEKLNEFTVLCVPDKTDVESPDIYESVNNLQSVSPMFKNDPVLFMNKSITPGLKLIQLEMGPCQPVATDLPNGKFPKDESNPPRSFSTSYYTKLVNGKSEHRSWITYSPSMNRIYCWTCKLFGSIRAQKNSFVTTGCNSWGHLGGLYGQIHLHETCKDHLEAELNKIMYINNNRVDIQLMNSNNKHVAMNRAVVHVLMDIVLCLSKHNDAFRGHTECLTNGKSGKFLDWVNVFAKHHTILATHLENIKSSTKKQRLTFLSKSSQNSMLNCIAESIRETILKEVKAAGMYSLILDSTTDVSKLDQFAFVLRYCTNDGLIKERLICVDETVDSTGNGMYELFCKVCDKYNLNWRHDLIGQAYNGASNMQGAVKGLRSLIQNENKSALHIWCSAHCLNLAVVDCCEATECAQDFFGTISSLVTFLGARKRTATYVEFQKQLYKNQRIRRLKSFSATRWTYHDRSLEVIQMTYKSIILTLKKISLEETDKKNRHFANSFLKQLNSFKFVLTMHMMRNIFSITTPLSNYLQNPAIDFIQAIHLIKVTRQQIQDLRAMKTESVYENLFTETKLFCEAQDLEEHDLAEVRTSHKKRMSGEISSDERITSANYRYVCEVYRCSLDAILSKLDDRFSGSENIFKEFSLLLPERLELNKVSPNKFDYLVNCDQNDTDSDDSEETIHVTAIYSALCKMGMVSAFPNLFMAYKWICTLLPISETAERCFSKLKLIKTKLRSTVGEKRLDNLMLISCNPDIEVSIEDAINKFASTSSVLQKALMFVISSCLLGYLEFVLKENVSIASKSEDTKSFDKDVQILENTSNDLTSIESSNDLQNNIKCSVNEEFPMHNNCISNINNSLNTEVEYVQN
ncbi:zinc finger MYM-type protein 1-like [Metopolophium dirhodum]|uniref:zinc finger MYM-type protein 1-like n=1 Tax=Metopolophium dirhodum TaxID=44670 RepID=UPI00298FA352|nr:zinc finger MYM-type protein 1-like [Metopolophium dirhodum]